MGGPIFRRFSPWVALWIQWKKKGDLNTGGATTPEGITPSNRLFYRWQVGTTNGRPVCTNDGRCQDLSIPVLTRQLESGMEPGRVIFCWTEPAFEDTTVGTSVPPYHKHVWSILFGDWAIMYVTLRDPWNVSVVFGFLDRLKRSIPFCFNV